MAAPLGHIRHQLPVIAGFGRLAGAAVWQRFGGGATAIELPGRELVARVPPRDPALVRDYVRWCGGDPGAYRGRVPAHLFPQWAFPLFCDALRDIPYNLAGVLNGGCRMEVLADLPIDEPLTVRAQLTDLEEKGSRVLLRQRVATELSDGTVAIEARFDAIIPNARPAEEPARKGPRKPKPTVPADVREVGWWRLPADAGLTFACLTGDFNPVHWIAPWGRAMGMGGTILHGFATMGRAVETLNRVLWAGDTRRLRAVEVRFTRPVRLPGSVGCFVRDHELYVGDAPGGLAYLTGTFEEKADE